MKTFDFVIYLSREWDHYHRKSLILKLIQELEPTGSKFLLLEPAITPFHALFFHTKRLLSYLKTNHVRQIRENAWVYIPFMFFHFYLGGKFKLLASMNKFILRRQILRLVKCFKFSNSRWLWLFRPECVQYLNTATETFVLYDYYDDYLISFSGKPLRKNMSLDKMLIGNANLVICTTEKLLSQAQRYNTKCILVPNAAEVRHFNKALTTDPSSYTALENIKKPIIGYHGNIRNWIDFELIEFLLKNTEYSYVFAGTIAKNAEKSIQKLKKYPNFIVTGHVPYEILPSVIRNFDVELIPFKLNSYNESVIPNKLFEAMASGKPVVASALPDIVRYWSKWVYTYSNYSDIQLALVKALKPNSKKYPVQVPEMLEKISWENRVKVLLSHLISQK